MQSSHVGVAKETQSPRFQAILRVTSGRKKKAHDIKSFSHELNSKGVRPFPVWRSRAVGHMEVSIIGYSLVELSLGVYLLIWLMFVECFLGDYGGDQNEV